MFEGIWVGQYATDKIASTTEYCISTKREKYVFLMNKFALTGQMQILFKSVEPRRCYGRSLHQDPWARKLLNPVWLTHIYVIHDVNQYNCW